MKDEHKDALIVIANFILAISGRDPESFLRELRVVCDEISRERRALEELVDEKRRLLETAGMTLTKLEREFNTPS